MGSLKQIQSISFIGSGNVATHLALAFMRSGLNIAEVYSPNNQHASDFAKMMNCSRLSDLSAINPDVDLVLIAVPDTKIGEVFKALPKIEGIVAHTSGFCSMSELLTAENFGVFYPLQTFTRNKEISFSEVPFCIEGNDEETSNRLADLAKRLSNNVHHIDSPDRRYLHLAAVMVNNFTNHIYHIAGDILENRNFDFNLLLPLIKETADKAKTIAPEKAQTGPAKRNDISTITEHEKMLIEYPEYRKLYSLISSQISKKYHG